MLKVVNSNEIIPEKWDALIKSSPVATWFQTRKAYGFFDSLSFLDAFAIGVENDGQLKGVVVGYVQKEGGRIKQFFSKRAILLGGPLLAGDIGEDELALLLGSLKTRLKKLAIYIETRNFNDYSQWQKWFEKSGFKYEPHYNVQVDTTSIDLVNGKLDRNRRRNIKKALDNGVVFEQNPDEADLKQFYSLLEELYRTKVKTPLYPFEFFEKFRQIQDSRFFMVKSPDGELIGGLMCVEGEGAVFAWMACGSDQKYRALSPSVMANYAGICYAAEQGIPRFDFMGAGRPGDGGYGVRDFKLKFGGELVENGRFVCVCNRLLFGVGKLAVSVLKKL